MFISIEIIFNVTKMIGLKSFFESKNVILFSKALTLPQLELPSEICTKGRVLHPETLKCVSRNKINIKGKTTFIYLINLKSDKKCGSMLFYALLITLLFIFLLQVHVLMEKQMKYWEKAEDIDSQVYLVHPIDSSRIETSSKNNVKGFLSCKFCR